MSLFLFNLAIAAASPVIDGAWTVDLSPAGDGSYTQPMQLDAAEDGMLGGVFYGTAIETGRWVEQGDRKCVTFVTSDGTGPYLHSACLAADGSMEGQSLSTGRDHLFLWKANR